MGILPGSGPLGSGPTGPGSGFSVMPNRSNLLSPQDSVDVSGNEVQILFLSANFLNISVV